MDVAAGASFKDICSEIDDWFEGPSTPTGSTLGSLSYGNLRSCPTTMRFSVVSQPGCAIALFLKPEVIAISLRLFSVSSPILDDKLMS